MKYNKPKLTKKKGNLPPITTNFAPPPVEDLTAAMELRASQVPPQACLRERRTRSKVDSNLD